MKPAAKKLIRVAVGEKDPLRFWISRTLRRRLWFCFRKLQLLINLQRSRLRPRSDRRAQRFNHVRDHGRSQRTGWLLRYRGTYFVTCTTLGQALDTALTYHRTWEAGLEGTRGSPPSTLTFFYENHCKSTGYYPISQPLRSLESNQPGRVKAANFALNRTKMTTVGVDWPDAPLSRSEFEP